MSVYDEVEIEDMDFDPETQTFYYPCPCGDKFQISLKELKDGEDLATCPSCSLILRVVSDEVINHSLFERISLLFPFFFVENNEINLK